MSVISSSVSTKAELNFIRTTFSITILQNTYFNLVLYFGTILMLVTIRINDLMDFMNSKNTGPTRE